MLLVTAEVTSSTHQLLQGGFVMYYQKKHPLIFAWYAMSDFDQNKTLKPCWDLSFAIGPEMIWYTPMVVLSLHSQQSFQWTVVISVQKYACCVSGPLRCNFSTAQKIVESTDIKIN